MLSLETVKDLNQIRLDELSARHIHQKLLAVPQKWTRIVDILTIIVPILYFAPKLIWTDGNALQVLSKIDVVLFVVLLAVAVFRKVLNWDELLQGHRISISKNTRIANQARELAVDEYATEDASKWFIKLAKEPDQMEQQLLEEVTIDEKREAYREALKEFSPAKAESVCQVCGASVWEYKPGSCQACGGTPPERRG